MSSSAEALALAARILSDAGGNKDAAIEALAEMVITAKQGMSYGLLRLGLPAKERRYEG